MTTDLVINSIVEWVNGENPVIERILWISEERTDAVVYDISNLGSLPMWRKIEEIDEAIALDHAIKRTIDPNPAPSLLESQIPQKHLAMRDQAWRLVSDLVSNEPLIYESAQRGQLVKNAANLFGVHKMTIYKHMRKYWAGGKTKNALLPAYSHCGPPGQEKKKGTGVKRGRPSRLSRMDPERPGINIDDDTKKIFRLSFRLYYNSKEQHPLKRAYDLMIKNHFNVGMCFDSGIPTPSLPPPWELPTLDQFRYWFKKGLDLRATMNMPCRYRPCSCGSIGVIGTTGRPDRGRDFFRHYLFRTRDIRAVLSWSASQSRAP